MNRRLIQRSLIGACAVTLAATIWIAGRPDRRLNVVIICLDTVRYDSFFLNDHAAIPDRLSSWLPRAIEVNDAQSAAPWTIPSVASVMTGLYPPRHGAGYLPSPMANLDNGHPSALAQGVPTLASVLEREGYDTAAFYENPMIDPIQGVLRGFNLTRPMPSAQIAAAAGAWLDSGRDQSTPFLLYLHFLDAHDDAARRPVLEARAALLPASLQPAARNGAPVSSCLENTPLCTRYLAYISAIHNERERVAFILEGLRRRHLLENTIVVLFSDHGEEFQDHRAAERQLGGDPRGSYGAGHGHSLYAEMLHVPLLIWHPGFRGQTFAAPVSLVDIAPTLSGWLRVRWPEDPAGGISLGHLRLIDPKSRLRFATGIAYGAQQFAGMRDGMKWIEGGNPARQLMFDLRSDPLELKPLAPSIDRSLASATGEIRKMRPAGETAVPAIAQDRLQSLRSIGYLTGRSSTPAVATEPPIASPVDATLPPRLWASPEAIDCTGSGASRPVNVYWSAPAADRISLRFSSPSPSGKEWLEGSFQGHGETGAGWKLNNATLYLQNISDEIAGPTGKTLATLTFHCAGGHLSSETARSH